MFLLIYLATSPSHLLPFISLYKRLAAEDQIHTLQAVIDETFQQFALDDSEDDFCEVDSGDASSISCDSPRLANGKKGGLGPVLLPALQSDI